MNQLLNSLEISKQYNHTFPRTHCVEPDPEGPYLFDLFFGWYEFDLKLKCVVCLVSTPSERRLWPLILGMECHYLPGCSWTLLQVSNLECTYYVENVVCHIMKRNPLYNFPKKYTFIMSAKTKCEIKYFIKGETKRH